MKAVVLYEKGSADVLRVADVADPTPGPSDVLVRVSFSGVNRGDVLRRARGMFPEGASPPYVLGLEGAGVITETGSGVRGLRAGQRVAFLVESGGYAQIATVPEGQVIALPDDVPDEIAAASICTGLTAWHLTRLTAPRPQEWVLVHGGAGGVGSMLIQICSSRSARVIAAVGTEAKAGFARSIGAEETVDARNANIAERVLSITQGRGVSTIFDCVGQAVTEANFACLSKGGQIAYYGSASGHAQFPGDKVLGKEAHIIGFVIFSMFGKPALWKDGVQGLMTLLSQQHLKVNVQQLPMGDAARAHGLLEQRNVTGKLVLDMR
jgi:NADPH2:quinone reductase